MNIALTSVVSLVLIVTRADAQSFGVGEEVNAKMARFFILTKQAATSIQVTEVDSFASKNNCRLSRVD